MLVTFFLLVSSWGGACMREHRRVGLLERAHRGFRRICFSCKANGSELINGHVLCVQQRVLFLSSLPVTCISMFCTHPPSRVPANCHMSPKFFFWMLTCLQNLNGPPCLYIFSLRFFNLGAPDILGKRSLYWGRLSCALKHPWPLPWKTVAPHTLQL